MNDIVETMQMTLAQMRWVEWVSVVAAAIYVILAARNNIWCWLFGIISAILWTYAAAVYYKLYVDAFLQGYYVAMGVYGWWAWSKRNDNENALPISILKNQQHFQIIGGGLVLTFVVGYFFSAYTDAVATYLDAFTTVFSIMTTVLVARRVLENWLYWIVIDATYVYLYGSRGGYLFALLNVIYVIIAMVGYLNWKRELEKKGDNLQPSSVLDDLNWRKD